MHDLEGQQITLHAWRRLLDDGIDFVAAALLVVHRVMLDVADNVLRFAQHLMRLPTRVPARIGSSPWYSKVRPLRGSRVMLTPPPRVML